MEYLNDYEKRVLEYLRQYYLQNYDLEISIIQSDYKKIKGVPKEYMQNILRALVIRQYLQVSAFDIAAPGQYRHFCFTEKALQYFNSFSSEENHK